MAVRLIQGLANIEDFERLDSGSLKVRAIARTPGILTYFDSNGPRRELVTPEFLRSVGANGFPLAGQLGDLPVTLEHPPELLHKDAAKVSRYGVGATTPKVKVYTDGRIQVDMEVSDSTAIQAIESGQKRGVSLGYLCDINRKDGIYQGIRYDAEQCPPFTADHLAIVANPRAKNALIQSFERIDSDDFAVALYEDFKPTDPRSDSEPMSTNTAATVALSDIANAVPETFQIDIAGSPHRVDAATYQAIQAERLDMKKKMKAMEDKYMEDEDDDDDSRKDAAVQITSLLTRCDADTLPDALHNLNVLVSRFDNVATVADAVDCIDQMQGRIDALSHSENADNSGKFDSDDMAALLKRLDAETPADALTKLDGQDFVANYSHMLPPGFNLDSQTLTELQLEAIKTVEPGLTLHGDSEETVAGAFAVVAARYGRVDSTDQLDKAFARTDMVHSQLPANAHRPTGTSMIQKPSESLFSISKAARR